MTADKILSLISHSPKLKAREIAKKLGVTRREVNSLLYGKLKDKVSQDEQFRWTLKIPLKPNPPLNSPSPKKDNPRPKTTFEEPTDLACPDCEQQMIRRNGRYGLYLRCTKHPDCSATIDLDDRGGVQKPKKKPLKTDIHCPECRELLLIRNGTYGPWLGCSAFPKCRGKLKLSALTIEQSELWLERLKNHESQKPARVLKTISGEVVVSGYKPKLMTEAAAVEPNVRSSQPALPTDGVLPDHSSPTANDFDENQDLPI